MLTFNRCMPRFGAKLDQKILDGLYSSSVAKMTSSFDCCARLQKKSFSLQAFQALSLKIAVTFERDAQKNMT